jgi:hypothetical protein
LTTLASKLPRQVLDHSRTQRHHNQNSRKLARRKCYEFKWLRVYIYPWRYTYKSQTSDMFFKLLGSC